MSTVNLNAQIQFVESDQNGSAAIAFFDLDHTLISGYSIIAMALERIRHGLTRGELRESTAILRAVLSQTQEGGSGDTYHRLVRRLSQSLAGISEDTLARLGEQAYENTIARSLFSEAIDLIEAHRRAGHRLVIITAATHYQVDPIARVLDIDEACCTHLEVTNGHFTGRTLTPLCHGEGKAMAARQLCKRWQVPLDNCWFYSDSSEDLPLLRIVGHPVAVNPSESLVARARVKRWPILHFKTRGLPTVETLMRTFLTVETIAATTAVASLSKRLHIGSIIGAKRMTQVLGEVGIGWAGIDLDVEGVEYLTGQRPAIFIFNHQSQLDAMILAHLLREDVVALCDKDIDDSPILGPLMRQVDTIVVDSENQTQSAVLNEVLNVLASGRSLIIAPEGARSLLGEIQFFKDEAFLMAKTAGVPVVPIVLHNVRDALPKGGLFIRPTTVRVTILPPIQPDAIASIRQICAQMEMTYSQLLENSRVASLPHGRTSMASWRSLG